MSFTISKTPTALNAINKLIWEGSLTDIGTDPVEKRAAWKLNGPSGLIVELSSTRPGSSGDLIYLDFTQNIKALVKTRLPTIGALGVGNDSTFIMEFTLIYGDISINKDTGAVTESVGSSSGPFKVFNGVNNIWDTALITTSGVYFLTYRPIRYDILRNSLDYIWVLGSTTLVYTVYYADGTTQTVTQSAPYDVNIVPVGLPFLSSLLSQSVDNVIELRINLGSRTYYVGFERLCEANVSYMEILFLEPLGGRSIMVFQDIDGAGTTSEINTANIFKTENNIAALRNGGDSVIYKRTFGTYSFTRQLSNDQDEIRWCHSFGASTEHHLLIKDVSGARFWARFKVETTNLDYKNKTFSCSGSLARSIDSPYVL